MSSKKIKIALVGNPNTGKTSLFNQLTGMTQKVGNYPGITVDKKQGGCKLPDGTLAQITDLPGTYSINPNSLDESIVLETLLDTDSKDYPDLVVVVAEVENIKRNLFLFTQVQDLKIPAILVINMADQMDRKGISIDLKKLKEALKTEIVLISARKKEGIEDLKQAIVNYQEVPREIPFQISGKIDVAYFNELKNSLKEFPLYKSWLLLTQKQEASFVSKT